MNAFLSWIKQLFLFRNRKASISDAAFRRYLICCEEWNEHFHDDAWVLSDRGAEVESYMEWFEDAYE